MGENKVNCEHACKNTCEALEQALKMENGIWEIYNSVVDECSLPEAKSLLSELMDEKKKVVQKLGQKMDELMEKSHIIDDIAESYNKEVE
jgi:rubrerythrin